MGYGRKTGREKVWKLEVMRRQASTQHVHAFNLCVEACEILFSPDMVGDYLLD